MVTFAMPKFCLSMNISLSSTKAVAPDLNEYNLEMYPSPVAPPSVKTDLEWFKV